MVLAGGASRRFGGAQKGLEQVGGFRIIDRVASALQSVTGEVVLAANAPDSDKWLPGVAIVRDREGEAGGLAGVNASLQLGRDVLVVAWDMPFVSSALLAAILDAGRFENADVVVPASDAPCGFEPFCALYSRRVLAPLSAFLGNGGRAAHEFLGRLEGVHRMSKADVRKLGDPRRLFFSVNTREDLELASAMAAAS